MTILAPIAAFLLTQLIRVSPFVIKTMTPILLAASEDVWKKAYPLAQGIIADLMDNLHLDGLDKHKLAVKQLEAALVVDGKLVVKGTLKVSRAALGQIVLAAYANAVAKVEVAVAPPVVTSIPPVTRLEAGGDLVTALA